MRIINKYMFKPTYLYIKTHNKTGLKYFGKTIRDPEKYQGSGYYWANHIKKYGYDVTTEILGYYTDKSECLLAAVEFSNKNNIVESTDWANLRPETLDGGDTSQTENYKKYLPQLREYSKKCKWWNNGITQTFKPNPPDDSFRRGRLHFNNIGAKKGAEAQRNKIWINNGDIEMMVLPTDNIPSNFIVGRLKSTAFANGRHNATGSKWWNNGTDQVMSKDCPGAEWAQGRIRGGGYGNRKS